MTTISIKTGDTFSLPLQRVDSTGAAVDISGYTVTAAIRGTGFSDTGLTVTKTDAVNGKFTVSQTAANTANWPSSDQGSTQTTVLQMDVKYDDGTNVVHSDTLYVNSYTAVTA